MATAVTYLSHHDGNRKNNFTPLRFLLAWMVIYSHAFAIQPVAGTYDPLRFLRATGLTTGQIAVDGFFIISGFLVAGSLLKRGVLDYSLSRALRVLPGLAVCVLLTVFVLGPIATTLSLGEYFGHSQTHHYLKNMLGVPLVNYRLPGVFESNATGSVNGSLWSIPFEVRCYIALAVAGAIGLLSTRLRATFTTGVIAAFFLWSYIDPELINMKPHRSSALLCFALGVMIYCNRDRIRLHPALVAVAAAALYFSYDTPAFKSVYPPALAYLLFYLAYCTRYIDVDGKLGDISYGVYIYAYPVQQVLASVMPAGTPYTNMLLTTTIVVPLALLSWRIIERPALTLKSRLHNTDTRLSFSRK